MKLAYNLLIGVLVIVILTIYHKKPKVITKTIYKEKNNSLISLGFKDLEKDLKDNESFLSSKNRTLVINSIKDAGKIYNINPVILYGLIYTESSFRYWIKHKPVLVGRKKEQAIGLTGVMFSWWGKKLIKAKIIETRSDLFGIRENIMSCAYILNELKQKPLLKGTKNKTESALRRYFGGNYKWYSQKIENKIGKLIFKKVYQ